MFKQDIDYDLSLEAAVLGVLLIEPRSYSDVYSILMPESFYSDDHRLIYETVTKMHDEGHQIDLLTVARKMYDQAIITLSNENTGYFLSKLTDAVVSSAHLETWCYMLRELAVKRAAIQLTSSGMDRSADPLDIANDIDKKLKRIMDIKVTDDWKDGSQVAVSLLKRMEENSHKQFSGVTTTFKTLDNINGGFKPANLVLLGARTAVGKSALMGRLIVRIAKAGYCVGAINLEMDNEDIMSRMVSYGSGVPFYQIDKGQFYSPEDNRRVLEEIARVANLPIKYSDTAKVDMRDIRAKAEKLMKKNNLQILFIDYLQLIEPEEAKGRNREQEVAKISRGCKLLAKALKIPIVLLVQLNREADGQEPQLKHLRESGSLEQDADVVMLLHRDTETEDPEMKKVATLFVRKWRNGTPLKVDLEFDGETMKFTEKGEEPVYTTFGKPPDNPRAGIYRYPTAPNKIDWNEP